MSKPLFEDKQVSKMMLQSLRNFSEACQPPLLRSDCPFSIEIEPGLRGCAEECMDILGEHGAPLPTEVVVIEAGLSVRRKNQPRARHSSVSETQSFDARAIYLQDESGLNLNQWSLLSLLYKIKELVSFRPSSTYSDNDLRLTEIDEVVKLLEARGLQLDSHLAPALRREIGMTLASHIISNHKSDAVGGEIEQRWTELLFSETMVRHIEVDDKELSSNPIIEVFSKVVRWASLSSFQEVLRFQPPVELSFKSLNELGELEKSRITHQTDLDSSECDSIGQWMLDRFTETYIDRWKTESMRREWKYIHGQLAPPCSPYEMKAREVKERELAIVMAEKLSRMEPRPRPRNSDSDSLVSTELLTYHLVKPAVNFLEEGRRTEATALFEAVLQSDPESEEANNNLGFCLIPDNPELALTYFDKASANQAQPTSLVSINRMLALAKLGKITILLSIAADIFGIDNIDKSVSKYEFGEGQGTWLWDVDSVLSGDKPVLVETKDFVGYARYIVKIAASSAT